MRDVSIQMGFLRNAPASCMIAFGSTRVLCSAYCQNNTPGFLEGSGSGWVTAEYGMLPGSTITRKERPGLKQDGRAVEIRRLIGRSLRSAVDLKALSGKTITLDCDVIDADGGTRTAAITGAWCAMYALLRDMAKSGKLDTNPIKRQVAAVSCGLVNDVPAVDLCYAQDSAAQADINVVMTSNGDFVEIQGTGEKRPFTRYELDTLLKMAQDAIDVLFDIQRDATGYEV